MFGRFFLILSLCLGACARPNYQDPASSTRAGIELSKPYQFEFLSRELRVDLQWEKKPTESEMGIFTLRFYRNDATAMSVDLREDLAVVLWMPSMGHGSSPVQITKISAGLYRVERVFFVMPGEWDVQIQLKEGSSVLDQIIYPVSI